MGFGRHSRMHAAKLLELSTDLPIVIEIVDAEEKMRSFLPVVLFVLFCSQLHALYGEWAAGKVRRQVVWREAR